MSTKQPGQERFGRAIVGLHRTEPDAGLLAYAGMLVRAEVVSELQCVHVLADGRDDPAERDRVLAELKAEADRYLGTLPAAARVTFDVRHGPLLDKLLLAIAECQADLALIGHRQDHPLRRSLARRLAELARCSVWLVPDGTPAAVTGVLVPVDFSAAAGHALQTASGVAARLGLSEVTTIHVYFDETRTTYEGEEAAVRGREEAAFAAFVEPLDTSSLRVVPLYREGVHPADTVRRVADELGVDLVVMGTRGRSKSAAVLLGSVAQETLITSRVPVLVVRSPGRQVSLFRALLERLWRHEPGEDFTS